MFDAGMSYISSNDKGMGPRTKGNRSAAVTTGTFSTAAAAATGDCEDVGVSANTGEPIGVDQASLFAGPSSMSSVECEDCEEGGVSANTGEPIGVDPASGEELEDVESDIVGELVWK